MKQERVKRNEKPVFPFLFSHRFPDLALYPFLVPIH
jgi:hypothetical protein